MLPLSPSNREALLIVRIGYFSNRKSQGIALAGSGSVYAVIPLPLVRLPAQVPESVFGQPTA